MILIVHFFMNVNKLCLNHRAKFHTSCFHTVLDNSCSASRIDSEEEEEEDDEDSIIWRFRTPCSSNSNTLLISNRTIIHHGKNRRPYNHADPGFLTLFNSNLDSSQNSIKSQRSIIMHVRYTADFISLTSRRLTLTYTHQLTSRFPSDSSAHLDKLWSALRASLSGTCLQTRPEPVTPQKGHSVSVSVPSCPPKGLFAKKTVEAT